MEGNRFDDLTRSLATSHSRRTLVGGLIGGALSLVGAGRASAKSDRVKICHKPGTPAQQTLTVDNSAVPGHLGHGDYANATGCCATGVPVCVDTAGTGTCCPAPSRCLGNGVCCTPTTCAAQGVTCGTISDTCGGTLDCGTCGGGQTCHQGSCCTPTCQGNACGGGLPDGCGGEINCTCPAEQVCHDGSCCTPTCPGNACGNDLPNGCGGTINCKCLAGDVCHDGECCTPTCQGNACGAGVPDGCGGEINCKCLAGQTCHDGQCCVPATSCPPGQICGTAPDGCGGTLECGSCGADTCQVCSDDGSTCLSTCAAPRTCTSGTCKLPDGATGCNGDAECHSGVCAAGVCQATPGADGTACDSDADCLGGHCVNIVAGTGICCSDGQVCSGVCCTGGQVCNRDNECCSPVTCADLGATCGFEHDGCAFELDCGTCGGGEECIDNVCQPVVCVPARESCDSSLDQCCEDLICRSGNCCHPVGSECFNTAGGGDSCCDGGNCVDGGPLVGSTCVGCKGDFEHSFGGPVCTESSQCCSNFCHTPTGNCCRRANAPCSEIGPFSFECCPYLGLTCSGENGTCIQCRSEGQSCVGSGTDSTCCLGMDCQSGVCVLHSCGFGGRPCQEDSVCCPGFACDANNGVCQLVCLPEGLPIPCDSTDQCCEGLVCIQTQESFPFSVCVSV